MRSAYGHNANIGNDVTRQVKTSQDKSRQDKASKIQQDTTITHTSICAVSREEGRRQKERFDFTFLKEAIGFVNSST
jgi:hypothetical protein